MTAALLTRVVLCPFCTATELTQIQRSPGIWRPLGCPACLANPLHMSAGDVRAEFGPRSEIRCPGKRASGDRCGRYLGTVGQGAIAKLQLRPAWVGRIRGNLPGFPDRLLPIAPALISACPSCSTPFVLELVPHAR